MVGRAFPLGRRFAGTLAAGLLLLLVSVFAQANIFVVTTTADGNNSACTVSLCTLRDAIIAANANSGPDTITLPSDASPYMLTIAGTGEDAAATGDLDVTGDLTINGGGSSTTFIDGGSLDRVFQVLGAVSLTLNDLTVRHGATTGFENGGGIWAEDPGGTVILNSAIVISNSAVGGFGGGISASNAMIANSVIFGNLAGQRSRGLPDRRHFDHHHDLALREHRRDHLRWWWRPLCR